MDNVRRTELCFTTRTAVPDPATVGSNLNTRLIGWRFAGGTISVTLSPTTCSPPRLDDSTWIGASATMSALSVPSTTPSDPYGALGASLVRRIVTVALSAH